MRPRRWSRLAGYAMMAGGGATAFAIPTPSIQAATGWVVYLWATFLLLGGTLCTYGAITDRWIGEYTGLPLIGAAFGVYSAVLALGLNIKAAAAALAFGAVALILFDRWRDIDLVRLEATREATQRSGGTP
jgi:hypothetical protein